MLDIELRDGIAILHMRQPGVNRLTTELLRRLTAALEFVGSRAVVLTGYGATFAVGVDGRTTEELAVAQRYALLAVQRHPGAVIAAINGSALDAGFALAAAADVRLMAHGLIGTTRPASGGSGLSATALEVISTATGPFTDCMLLSGETLTVEHATAIGLVEQPTRPARLLDKAIERATALARPVVIPPLRA